MASAFLETSEALESLRSPLMRAMLPYAARDVGCTTYSIYGDILCHGHAIKRITQVKPCGTYK